MAIVTPTDRPKSVRNRCEIEVFGGVFAFSLCFLDISVGVRAFVIDFSQISSFSLIFASSFVIRGSAACICKTDKDFLLL